MIDRKKTFIEKAINKYGDKYDYSLVEYVNSKTKVKIICSIHGVFFKTPNDLLNGYECTECSKYKNNKVKKNKEKKYFIDKSNKIHNNKYDYSLVEYVNNKTNVKIICPIHGVFEQTPIRHYKTNGCKKCSYDQRKHTNEDIIKKFKETHKDKYDYSLVKYNSYNERVKIICPIHGVFEQTPKFHIKGCNCPKCSSKNIIDAKRDDLDSFIKKGNLRHNNKYDYSLVEYVNSNIKVNIICPIHGIFEQPPRDHLSGHGCGKCGQIISKSENDIYEYIKSIYNGKIVRNNRKILDGKEIDILLPDKNIGIEYCGLYWHSNLFKNDKYYHKNKMEDAYKNNIRLVSIFENEWLLKKEIVKSKLKHIIGINNTKKIYARKTKIFEINNNLFKEFLNKYHIQGYNKCSVKYGLFYEDELVSVIGFKNNSNYWDLNRFASKYIVVGGFSKLLKHFIKQYNCEKIITFADLRYTDLYNNLYLKNGFKKVHISNPNYFYFKNNTIDLESRIKYQKNKLKKQLKYFDKNLTEFENMRNNNYNWIYDCGNIKYEMVL
jgi:Zn ribbon nucleic-acid-binding protein